MVILGDEYEYVQAENGRQAIHILQQDMNIDLMLLDINMPEMNGFQVLDRMNTFHWINDIPVIMISSEEKKDVIERAYILGAEDYIRRPFDAFIVRRRVQNILNLYANQKRLMQMVADQIYEKEIVDVIERDNVQTAKNIARIIQKKDEIKEYHHTEGTVYEYTRLRVASMFGKKVGEGGTHGEIIEKIWCRADLEHNCYIPMSVEAIQLFLDCYSQSKEDGKQKELELLNDYQIGLIQKEELQEAIGEISLSNYIAARKSFHQKYGYYPIKVPVYGLDGLDILRFEKGGSYNDQC